MKESKIHMSKVSAIRKQIKDTISKSIYYLPADNRYTIENICLQIADTQSICYLRKSIYRVFNWNTWIRLETAHKPPKEHQGFSKVPLFCIFFIFEPADLEATGNNHTLLSSRLFSVSSYILVLR